MTMKPLCTTALYQTQAPEWTKDTRSTRSTPGNSPKRNASAQRSALGTPENTGVDILWLMPIHEIGHHQPQGAPSRARIRYEDYYSVNPEFGSLDDLKHFVATAHAQGMRHP